MTRFLRLIIGASFIFAASCGSGSQYNALPTGPTSQIPASPTTVLVPNGTAASLSGSGFAPPTLTVSAGTTVTWGNNDSTTHTTTSDTGAWNMQMPAGSTASFKFTTPGTYTYHCTLHSFMKGTIVVQ
jgi:plastocyanin